MLHRFINNVVASICRPGIFRFDASTTKSESATKKDSDTAEHLDDIGVYCKQCRTRISHPSQAVEVQGFYHHVFTNPEGLVFEIGMYDKADCLAVSPAILEHTWFAGYAWQLVICCGCQSHLGWYYSKVDSPDFYGLILDRLRE